MIKVEVHLAEDGLTYEGHLKYYNNGHPTVVYWECKNPGTKNPGLSFFLRPKSQANREFIFEVKDTSEYTKDILSGKVKNGFHRTLFNQRKEIFKEISIFLKEERKKRYSTGPEQKLFD